MLRITCLLCAGVLGACGPASRPFDDDSGVKPPIDAPIDTPIVVQLPPTPGRELVNGAGRASSASYVMEVEVGESIGQRQITGATYRLEGNAAISP
jgi:hypothetical protein